MKVTIGSILFWIICSVSSLGQTVDTVNVWSSSMNRNFRVVVIVPDTANDAEQLPTLYLLHGYSGKYDNWIKRVPSIVQLANQFRMNIVCPDGGFSSWYLDSPVDSMFRYETFIADELVATIENRYSVLKGVSNRAITGLSMGGHGALHLLINHPDVFGAGGSMSGGVDIMRFPESWDLPLRLGSIKTYRKNWIEHSVFHQAIKLQDSNSAIILDCGIDDFFFLVNKELHQRLTEFGIKHDFIIRPGSHNWDYWANAIPYQILFFHRFFNSD